MAQAVADELIFSDGKITYSAKKPALRGSCNDVIEFSVYEEQENHHVDLTSSIRSCCEDSGEEEDCIEKNDHEDHNRHSTDNAIIQVETIYPNTSLYYENGESSKDAFLYYSNDDVRLNTLKLWVDEHEEVTNGAMNQSQQVNEQKQQQRKTKISFEISPLLMMADLLNEF